MKKSTLFFLSNNFKVYLIWLGVDYLSVSSILLTLLDMVRFYLDTY